MTTLDPRHACGVCRFWRKFLDEDGTALGNCHPLPPHYEGWPRTLPEEWCGEFALRTT